MGKIKRFNSIEGYLTRAQVAYSKGNMHEAMRYFKEVVQINPDHMESLYNLGLLYKHEDKFLQAIEYFRKAVSANPTFISIYDELANCLETIGKPEDAVVAYQKAVSIEPTLAILRDNLGNAFKKCGKLKESIPHYKIAIALDPNLASAYNNLGGTYHHLLKKNTLALQYLNKAISLNPNIPHYYYNLGIVFEEAIAYDKAIENYKKTIELDPTFIPALCHLHTVTLQTCDWSALPKIEKRIEEIGHEDPFVSITRNENPSINLQVAKEWSRDLERKTNVVAHVKSASKKLAYKKIRIGYVSGDIRNHPIGQMVATLFGLHDRNVFEVYVYSYGIKDISLYRKVAQDTADVFRDISNLLYMESAQKIQDDNIDILVDITGYTLGNKLEICSLRPAPIQVTWLGFPGTSGASFFDYAVVDKIVAPITESKYYTEKLVHLPRCYQVNNNSIQISKNSYTRKEFGLPQKGFIFTSFNQMYKIEPVMWRVWMNILKRVPDSVLWLWQQDNFSPKNLKKEAELAGVDPKRIIFSKKLPKGEHLARIKLADLGLDTRIYGGHTTTSDMLWAGVPVLTKTGNHFASRVCTSVLTRAELPELITTTLEEYENKAVYFAQHPEELKKIRNKITHAHLQKNLYDTEGFARDLEKAYLAMIQIHKNNEKPRHIEIT